MHFSLIHVSNSNFQKPVIIELVNRRFVFLRLYLKLYVSGIGSFIPPPDSLLKLSEINDV